jgi:predicted permease
MSNKRSGDDFADEVQSHIEIETDRLVEQGLSREQALASARRTFGNVTGAREKFYESSRWMWFDTLSRNIRYALLSLKASPLSTATIVVSLALGIGFNTAIFSLADQALLRVLPVEEPTELVQLQWDGPFQERGMGSVGYGSMLPYLLYKELRDSNDVFEDLFASAAFNAIVEAGESSEPVSVELVTGSYFPTLGLRPTVGRLFGDADDLQPDAHPVVVLSHEYWSTRFQSDPAIVGETVRVNDFPMTVIGVAAKAFRGIDWSLPPDIWVPTMMKGRITPDWNGLDARRTRFLHVFGRLKLGISVEQAQAQLQPWFKGYLQADTEREGWPQVTDQQLSEFLASDLIVLPGSQGESLIRTMIRQPVLILSAATVLVLLLACLNVANLSLAKTLSRARTTALRSALGASRGRLLAEQFIETALLAGLGCGAGILIAPPVNRTVLTLLPRRGDVDLALSSGLDLRVLLIAAGAAAFAALLSGLAPAFYAASVRPASALKRQSAGVAGGLGLRKALVVGQFALTLILLVGAGLFAQTLAALRAQGAGYSTNNLLMFRVAPLTVGYEYDEAKPLIRRILTSVQQLPEVEQASVARFETLNRGGWGNPITIQSDRRFATEESITMNAVSPEFFEALGTPIVVGRSFDVRDSRDDSKWDLRIAIVNEEFVRMYLNGVNPIGVMTGMGDAPDTAARTEIVGVVSDFKDRGLREPEPQIYYPLWQRGVDEGAFYVRTHSSSEAAVQSIRAAVREIDPSLAILSMRTLDDQLDRLLGNERMLATLAGAFAVVATLLAMIGLYGVLSFSAARRTKEIGIRLALGAPQRAAGGLIVREAATLAALGLTIALPICWALGRLIESQLFGVASMDPLTIAGGAAILTLVCLAASVIPARAASAVNPLDALRAE